MTDDFKKYLQNYEKLPEVSARKKKKQNRNAILLLILVFGLPAVVNYPPLMLLYAPFLIFFVIYACKEWVG